MTFPLCVLDTSLQYPTIKQTESFKQYLPERTLLNSLCCKGIT